MLSGEATNANFIVLGFDPSELEPKIDRTRGELANHYTTDAVVWYLYALRKSFISNMLASCIVSLTWIGNLDNTCSGLKGVKNIH
jgi:hypothetical protein